MKRWRVTAALLVAVLVMPLSGLAADEPAEPGDVLITELQTTGLDSEDDDVTTAEFVELYNNTNVAIDLTGWSLQIAAASSTNWQNVSLTPELGGSWQPDDHLLIANITFMPNADHTYTSGRFTKSGGHVRIVSPDTSTADETDLIIHDTLGWGTAAHPESTAASTPDSNQSLKRRLDENGFYIDTNNNSADFIISDTPFPQAKEKNPPMDPEDPDEDPDEEPENPDETPENPGDPPVEEPTDPEPETNLLAPILTELLPNPASPATDSEDEFVELFNPNNEPFPLKDFKLQTGSSFNYSVIFDEEVIPAQGYLLVYSKGTNLTLSNSSGDARLLDDEGIVIAEVDSYSDAEDGAAWALIGGSWQWTTSPTPALPNILALPTAETLKSKTSKSTTKKKASATKKASTKASKTTSPGERAIYEDPQEDEVVAPVHTSILAGVGIAALGYGLYEYRFDLQNRLERFRRYRAARR